MIKFDILAMAAIRSVRMVALHIDKGKSMLLFDNREQEQKQQQKPLIPFFREIFYVNDTYRRNDWC